MAQKPDSAMIDSLRFASPNRRVKPGACRKRTEADGRLIPVATSGSAQAAAPFDGKGIGPGGRQREQGRPRLGGAKLTDATSSTS
jgi:hypothetical protein